MIFFRIFRKISSLKMNNNIKMDVYEKLNMSCITGDLTSVKNIIEKRIDVNKIITVDHDEFWNDGYTFLMTASMYGHIDIVEELIKNGANLDTLERNGYTALMLSICHPQEEDILNLDIPKLLLKSGCDRDIVSYRYGKTFFNMLNEENLKEILEYVEEIDSCYIKPAKN
jgi:ankyrin repeat protein